MSKPKSKQSNKRKRTSSSSERRKARTSSPESAPRQKPSSAMPSAPREAGSNRHITKQAKVIAILREPTGGTIEALMRATGWQQHSVRGFLAAVVRKRLGLDLTSQATEHGRTYRIRQANVSAADKQA